MNTKLAQEFAAVAKDAEEILNGGGDNGAEGAAEGASALRSRLAEALAAADQTVDKASGSSDAVLSSIDDFIRERPYHVIGVALGVGLLLGLLLKRN